MCCCLVVAGRAALVNDPTRLAQLLLVVAAVAVVACPKHGYLHLPCRQQNQSWWVLAVRPVVRQLLRGLVRPVRLVATRRSRSTEQLRLLRLAVLVVAAVRPGRPVRQRVMETEPNREL